MHNNIVEKDTFSEFIVLTEKETVLFPPTKGPFLLNYKQMAFVRTNYSKEIWDSIRQMLVADDGNKVPMENLIALMNDMFEFVKYSKHFSETDGFQPISEVNQQERYIPFESYLDITEAIVKKNASDVSIQKTFLSQAKYLLRRMPKDLNLRGFIEHLENIIQACYAGKEATITDMELLDIIGNLQELSFLLQSSLK